MDVLSVKSKFMTGLLGRVLEKIVQKKFNKNTNLTLYSLEAKVNEVNTILFINAAISVPTSDLENIIKNNML